MKKLSSHLRIFSVSKYCSTLSLGLIIELALRLDFLHATAHFHQVTMRHLLGVRIEDIPQNQARIVIIVIGGK